MKGLIIKDLYMAKTYCRTHLLMALLFLIIAVLTGTRFYLFYPCLMSGILPMTLQSYDERQRWCSYSRTLPYTASQLVSVKYLLGLMLTGVILVLMTAAELIGLLAVGRSLIGGEMIAACGMLSLLSPAAMLPCIFRFGVEKGRMAYYLVFIVITSAIVLLSSFRELVAVPLLALIAVGVVLLYTGSWLLSRKFYDRAEAAF